MGDLAELVETTSAHSKELIQQSMAMFGNVNVNKHDLSQSLYPRIDWDRFVQADFISHAEYDLIRRANENLDYVIGEPDAAKKLAQLLLKIARNITQSVPAQQYVFTRMEEILGLNPADQLTSDHALLRKQAKLFQTENSEIDLATFMRAIRSDDGYIKKSASAVLAALLSECDTECDGFVLWICEQLSSGSTNMQAALSALCTLLRKTSAREVFIAQSGIGYTAGLLHRLGSGGNAQTVYECCFVLWVLTLHDSANPQFLTAGAIRALTEQVAAAPSRKVVRMALAALHNIASHENYDVLTEMLTCGLEKYLSNMMHANAHLQASDPEVESDCKRLYEILMKNYRDLSTYERWMSEVNTGLLRDGILHTEKFWRENARNLENDDFRMLRVLSQLLDSEDESVQGIALNDIGEFARFYPNGRNILKTIGAKDKAMSMLDQGSEELRQRALLCISKIMVTHWEFVR